MTDILLIIAIVLFFACGVVWFFGYHVLDRIKHPEEWQTTGNSGERILYNSLIKKFHIPEEQIFRNLYVPTRNGKTSEIDLIVISKKGLLVFECKNYGGNIYGDARRTNWIQYIGNQKNYFYSPLLQNKNHVKHLKAFLAKNKIDVPITPIIATITRGTWKVRNLNPNDYLLGYNCHFADVYQSLPDSIAVAQNVKTIIRVLSPLARPNTTTRKNHIQNIKDAYN